MCQCGEILIEKEFDVSEPTFDSFITYEVKLQVLFDRGCIRLVDEDDKSCLDHGEKFKVNFCPICGEKVE